MSNNQNKKISLPSKILVFVLFILYMIVLTGLLLFSFRAPAAILSAGFDPGSINNVVNLTPLKTIRLYMRNINTISVVNLLGNILVFLPAGFFTGFFFRQGKFVFCAIITALVSLIFESLQIFLSVGRFDVDDILLNTIGGILGFIIIRIIQSCKKT